MKPPARPSRTWMWIGAVLLLIAGSIASWVWAPAPVSNFGPGGRADSARQDLRELREGVELYLLQERGLPVVLHQLFGPQGVMDGKEPPVDPWGNDYAYEVSGERSFELRSAGEDGEHGTADDLVERRSGD